MNKNWDLVIGLEIHAQLNTQSKLFSRSSTEFGAESNTQVSFIDSAMPGMLPILNEECVSLAVKAGLALNGQINKVSTFDRKNYFYPDLPQGYQISQFFLPIMQNGKIKLKNKEDNSQKTINIERIHIEQDAGKSIHDQDPNLTFIDLNRVGVPLIEIVTAPDFSSPVEVEMFLKNLRNILRFCNVCDGDLEKGSMRCDANVSVRRTGDKALGTRVEVKNLNSFKNINKAIISEYQRQVNVIEDGGKIHQETRLYNIEKNITKSMRSKEEAQDYRYFPDPDLLPLKISDQFIDQIKSSMPELPEQKKKRYVSELNISDYYADVITAEKNVANFFDLVVKKADSKLSATWLVDELFGQLNKDGIMFKDMPITTENFISLITLIEKEVISGKIAKKVLDIMLKEPGDADQIVKKYDLIQVSDHTEVEKFVKKVLDENDTQVYEYKSGKTKLFGFFVGKVMQISAGKLNPKLVNEILKSKLK